MRSNIAGILNAVRQDTHPREALDRLLRDIDQVHVAQIVGFEIARIHAEPLAAKDIFGAEQVRYCRVPDNRADLPPREVRDRIVGSLIEQKVAIGPQKR
jgi:hypothetical protein